MSCFVSSDGGHFDAALIGRACHPVFWDGDLLRVSAGHAGGRPAVVTLEVPAASDAGAGHVGTAATQQPSPSAAGASLPGQATSAFAAGPVSESSGQRALGRMAGDRVTSGKGRVLVHHGLVQAARTRLVHHGLAQAGKTRAGGLRPSGSSTNRRTNGARRGAMSSGRLRPQLGLPRQQRQRAWHVARKKTCRPAGFADAGCATIAASPTSPCALKCPPAEPGVAGSCASLVSQTLQTPLTVEQGFLLQMHVGIGIGHQHKVEALT